jgi:hypothetical protein
VRRILEGERMSIVCEHGNLLRQCELCDAQREIATLRRTIELQANDFISARTRFQQHLDAWTANSAHWAQVLDRISDIASAGGPDACAHILDVIKRGS